MLRKFHFPLRVWTRPPPAHCCPPRTCSRLPFQTLSTLPLFPQLQSAQLLPPEEVVDEQFSPTKRQEAKYLWKTQRERTAWLVSSIR